MNLIDQYNLKVSEGIIEKSYPQIKILHELQSITQPKLCSYFFNKSEGLYIYGGVGTGKTMLMDMYFNQVPTSKKLRKHFRDFMDECRISLDMLSNQEDPIEKLAKNICSRYKVLCLDEISITDISDAMIFLRLFSILFNRSLIFVMTSNQCPKNLYKYGLNRNLFLPIIKTISDKMKILTLNIEKDYRMKQMNTFFIKNDIRFLKLFSKITNFKPTVSRDFNVLNNEFRINKCVENIACIYEYHEICKYNLGTPHYKCISENFEWCFIIGLCKIKSNDDLYRFIKLIDIFYDAKIKLSCISEVPIQNISSNKNFERCASRIMHMCKNEIEFYF